MAKRKKTKGRKDRPYINRELSWIEFNARVLDEGMQDSNPPLERLKFLSIVSSNFDEFFMVRVAGLKRQERHGNKRTCPSGLTPTAILRRVSHRIKEVVARQYDYLVDTLLPELAEHGVRLVRREQYDSEWRNYLHEVFQNELFPTLTPLAVKDEEFPLSGNLRLAVAFKLRPKGTSTREPIRLAVVPIPDNLDRFYGLPSEEDQYLFTLIEDVVVENAQSLFPGHDVLESTVMRITRDADLSVDEERDEDFMEAMQEVLIGREHSRVVRLALGEHTTPSMQRRLMKLLDVKPSDVYETRGPLDLRSFMSLAFRPGFEALRDEAWPPQQPRDIAPDADLWRLLRERDVLMHVPFESFEPVVRLMNEAADDPNVLAIKMTLYRTSGDSPIIRALERAATNGKHVTVLVELKARFDEGRNIEWAQQLEQVGVIVIYGIRRMKVHSKAVMIVRREPTGIARYIHLGTGNYNDKTAKLYTDMGLMTSREDIGYDVALFFNTVTGYSTAPDLRKLIMAPTQLRDRSLALIQREIQRHSTHNPGLIMAKMNSLVDPIIIEKLYEASRAGVRVLLNVRGICCLVPGVKRVSENIRVVSIIDRFLEHSRIYYFQNGGNEEIYLASADWMPRNLDKRIELMFPVESERHRERIRAALELWFRDNQNAHDMQPDGTWKRLSPRKREKPVRAQEEFYRQAVLKASSAMSDRDRSFVVRRKAADEGR